VNDLFGTGRRAVSPRNSMLSTVTIVGVGLIGGSFGLALKRRGLVQHIIGAGRSRESLERALKLGAIDEIADGPHEAVKRSCFVFLAAPTRAICRIAEDLAAIVPEDTIVTDAGSTKALIVEEAERCWRDPVTFVGSHPIAGSEKSGVQHATPDLFDGRVVAITPTDRTSRAAVQKVIDVWRAIGAGTLEIGPANHDRIMATTSHVPHVIASLLVALVHGIDSETARKLAGKGLKDSTRLAESSAEMWRDICLTNDANIKGALDRFRQLLDRATDYIDRRDEDRLFELFNEMTEYRKELFGDARDTNG
jgi:prephenate dehydrogenase